MRIKVEATFQRRSLEQKPPCSKARRFFEKKQKMYPEILTAKSKSGVFNPEGFIYFTPYDSIEPAGSEYIIFASCQTHFFDDLSKAIELMKKMMSDPETVEVSLVGRDRLSIASFHVAEGLEANPEIGRLMLDAAEPTPTQKRRAHLVDVLEEHADENGMLTASYTNGVGGASSEVYTRRCTPEGFYDMWVYRPRGRFNQLSARPNGLTADKLIDMAREARAIYK